MAASTWHRKAYQTLVWTSLLVAPSTSAQEQPDAERAYRMFQESDDRYREGRFAEAAELLEEAYRLDPEPVLLYNLARAYEGMGDTERAIDAYRRYLAEERDAPDRASIEARLVTLSRQQEEREALREAARPEAPAVAPARVEREPPPRSIHPIPWLLTGIGIAGVAVGAVLGVVAQSTHQSALDDPSFLSARASYDESRRLAIGANVGFGVGAALAVAGLIWGIVDLTRDRDEPPSE